MENQLVQGSAAWHEFRKSGIGSSDSAAIMGVGFNSIHDLWLEKCGLKEGFKGNHHTERGLLLEEPARQFAERELGIPFKPTVRKSRDVPFIFGSSDGWNDDNAVLLEIKCPEKELHNEIKDYYIPQVQHLMYVYEVKSIYYLSFMQIDSKPYGKIIEVKRDDAYIENLIEQEKQFWYHVQNFIEPELSDRDYVKRNDPEYQEKLMIYLQNKANAKMWDELAEKAKAELTSITKDNTISMGCKISKRIRIGNVDYKQLTNDIGIDAETINKYRKSPTTYFEIREGK